MLIIPQFGSLKSVINTRNKTGEEKANKAKSEKNFYTQFKK